jgi:hypothetical protein
LNFCFILFQDKRSSLPGNEGKTKPHSCHNIFTYPSKCTSSISSNTFETIARL